MSHKQVAKSSHQKPMWQILKNLSKCFFQLEGPLTSKSRRESQSILSKLATGASTREPVAKMSHENAKNLEILNFFEVFFAIEGSARQGVVKVSE